MTDFLWFALIGLIAGWLASQVMKGGYGLVGDLIVGLIGALLGGWLFSVIGINTGAGLLGSLITATVGAIVLIAAIRFVKKAT
jgi:uncharacterized membrane protein YeaQ/YmgE (transglycosylase-associated protein family)